MHSKYTNQPESDIGKWSPESFWAYLSKSVAWEGDGRRKCPVEHQVLRIWALGSFEQEVLVGEQQYLQPFH
jgi:hypothetical protein